MTDDTRADVRLALFAVCVVAYLVWLVASAYALKASRDRSEQRLADFYAESLAGMKVDQVFTEGTDG